MTSTARTWLAIERFLATKIHVLYANAQSNHLAHVDELAKKTSVAPEVSVKEFLDVLLQETTTLAHGMEQCFHESCRTLGYEITGDLMKVFYKFMWEPEINREVTDRIRPYILHASGSSAAMRDDLALQAEVRIYKIKAEMASKIAQAATTSQGIEATPESQPDIPTKGQIVAALDAGERVTAVLLWRRTRTDKQRESTDACIYRAAHKDGSHFYAWRRHATGTGGKELHPPGSAADLAFRRILSNP